MSSILAKIVADKRVEIAALKKAKPLTSFIDQIEPSQKDFYGAISRKSGSSHANFILECKKASPSKGLIRPVFDSIEIASIYQNYAAAISVLTDEKYFQGSYQYLQQVCKAVSCPVLNKDFFVDEYQVYLARYSGADAILLMLSVLDDETYNNLAQIAEKLNLAVLTEVSNEEECQRAVQLNAKLVGINNRNLRDLTTDINRTFELKPLLTHNCIVISESGIYQNHEVRKLAPVVDGFLVGSSIMAQTNIDLACRQLIFGNHKVCGLTQPQHAKAAKQAGAVFGGLIFFQKSPRGISLAKAKAIVAGEPSLNYIGVFVNESVEQVAEYATELNLYAVQLHGGENQDYIAKLKPLLPKQCQIWQALAVEQQIPTYSELADALLLDNKQAGSGQRFDWSMLQQLTHINKPCLLAGGIQASNINQAIDNYNQYQLLGLDMNSGAESAPGEKSASKLNDLFAKIRDY